MSGTDPALGGYAGSAGIGAHAAGAPTLIPLPGLLRSLLTEHLDPGYAAAAARPPRRRSVTAAWTVAAGLLVALVLVVAAQQARSVAPAARQAQQLLAGGVRAAEQRADQDAALRTDLAGQVEAARRDRLAGDAAGRRLLADLDGAEFAAAATAVHGPGVTVTVSEPPAARDLSDLSRTRTTAGRQVVLDRDLQLLVNSLWAAGAEAISVGGVRVGPTVTVRQAGGGMLVDDAPITSPFVLLAIGPPHTLHDGLDASAGMARMRLLESAYGAGVTVAESDELELPASSVRPVSFAGGAPR